MCFKKEFREGTYPPLWGAGTKKTGGKTSPDERDEAQSPGRGFSLTDESSRTTGRFFGERSLAQMETIPLMKNLQPSIKTHCDFFFRSINTVILQDFRFLQQSYLSGLSKTIFSATEQWRHSAGRLVCPAECAEWLLKTVFEIGLKHLRQADGAVFLLVVLKNCQQRSADRQA